MDPSATEAKLSGPLTAPGDYLKFSRDADLYFRATLYAEAADTAPVRVALYVQGGNLTDVSTDDE
jgi:hypothetical protein